jgi:competence protein ComGC
MSDKLNISNEMRQFDLKNRHFYDELNEEERKKFSTYLMLRWGSAIQNPNTDLQSYYIQSMNQQVNKHFWDLNKHPKLQWLLLTCVSPNMGVFKHEWIAFKGKTAQNKRVEFLAQLYPEMKLQDVEVMSKLTSDAEIKQQLLDMGYNESDIKKIMKDVANDH